MKIFHEKKINFVEKDKSGCCTQVFITYGTRNKWPLALVDRWSLFRGNFSTKIVWAGFKVVVVDRWSLFGGGQ